MKQVLSLILLMMAFTNSNAQQSFSSTSDTTQKTVSTVIDDTIEVRDIGGRQMKMMYKTADGKTITVKQKEELFKKYTQLGQSYGRANGLTVVTLMTPDDKQQMADLNAKLGADVEKKTTALTAKWLNQPIGPVTLTDINGKSYHLDQMKGKVVVLNFWFTTCIPCVKEMPELNEVVAAYKNKDVLFLGLALNTKEDIAKFLQTRTFDYTCSSAKEASLTFGIFAWPTHVVIDKKGIIRFLQVSGEQIKRNLTSSIDAALK